MSWHSQGRICFSGSQLRFSSIEMLSLHPDLLIKHLQALVQNFLPLLDQISLTWVLLIVVFRLQDTLKPQLFFPQFDGFSVGH